MGLVRRIGAKEEHYGASTLNHPDFTVHCQDIRPHTPGVKIFETFVWTAISEKRHGSERPTQRRDQQGGKNHFLPRARTLMKKGFSDKHFA